MPLQGGINMEKCKECGKPVAKGKNVVSYAARKLGYCKRCYNELFPERENRWPVLRLSSKGGWQRLVSPEKRKKQQEWIDELIERIDKENSEHELIK